jgi:hypothetical protein
MWVGRARLLRNGLGSLTVLSVIVAISVGLPAVDRALPASRPVTTDEPYQVGAGVSVVPPDRAQMDVTQTRPGPNRGTAVFMIGSVRYVIVVTPYQDNLQQAAERLRLKITSTRGYQVTGSEFSAATSSGLVGLQGGYTAPGRNGRYAVFVVEGLAIQLTASGADPELRHVLDEIEASIASISYRRPR